MSGCAPSHLLQVSRRFSDFVHLKRLLLQALPHATPLPQPHTSFPLTHPTQPHSHSSPTHPAHQPHSPSTQHSTPATQPTSADKTAITNPNTDSGSPPYDPLQSPTNSTATASVDHLHALANSSTLHSTSVGSSTSQAASQGSGHCLPACWDELSQGRSVLGRARFSK